VEQRLVALPDRREKNRALRAVARNLAAKLVGRNTEPAPRVLRKLVRARRRLLVLRQTPIQPVAQILDLLPRVRVVRRENGRLPRLLVDVQDADPGRSGVGVSISRTNSGGMKLAPAGVVRWSVMCETSAVFAFVTWRVDVSGRFSEIPSSREPVSVADGE
jgi:hypothetical protein